MKVCILSHCFPPAQGAAELYIGNLAEELAKIGLEIVVITNAFDAALPAFEKREIKIYRFANRFPPSFHNFGFMLELAPVLKKVYEKEKFNLLHSEHVFPVPKAGKFAEENRIPHVAVIEGISKISLYSKLVYLTHKFVLPRSHFDALVAWSKFLSEEFLKKWGIEENKIRIIPGGIDTEKFNPFVDSKELRNTLADPNQKLIFTAKPLNYTNVLGLAYVIKAMKAVKEHDCKLLIGGDGRKRKDLEKLARNLDLQKHVKFLGWIRQEKIPEYYAAADVVVDSIIYRHAGSVTVLESLASGKPNVLCDIECLPGENSFPSNDIAMLVKPRDEKDMARGIITLLEDEAIGEKIGMNAWNFVKENFSIDKIALQYKNLYEELL
jgi:glycosyltransferase involved in cell wall biosynthesis